MERMECWNIFEKTGNIEAYLNYTACTKEEEIQNSYKDNREDILYDSLCTSWNGSVRDASGRS